MYYALALVFMALLITRIKFLFAENYKYKESDYLNFIHLSHPLWVTLYQFLLYKRMF